MEEITFIYYGSNTHKRYISATDNDQGRGHGQFVGHGGRGHFCGGRGGRGGHGGRGGTNLLNGVDVSNPNRAFSGAELDALRVTFRKTIQKIQRLKSTL